MAVVVQVHDTSDIVVAPVLDELAGPAECAYQFAAVNAEGAIGKEIDGGGCYAGEILTGIMNLHHAMHFHL